MVFNDQILSFTGDGPQRNLIISFYDLDWNPLSPFVETILTSENDQWNWFPSGVVYHDEYEMWFVAFTHMQSNGSANQDSIVVLAAFNSEFELLDRKELSDPGFTRPHLALIDDTLIVGYDNGNLVYLEKWSVQVEE